MENSKTRRQWTQDEEEFIRLNLDKMSTLELAEHFSVSRQQIIKKLHRLGLSIKKAHGITWTENDDNVLFEHFEYAPKNFLMNLFPGRTWNAIYLRGSKTLNLPRKSQDKYSINYKFFSEWTEESAYFLGFILADGHIHYGEAKYLQIEVQKRDIDILQKLKAATEFEGKIINAKKPKIEFINGIRTNSHGSVKIQINNAKIVLDLNEKGVPLGNKTYCTKFPENIPPDYIRHFIRGAIDGDGSLSFNKKHEGTMAISFCGNYDLVREIKDKFPVDCSKNTIFKSSEHCWNFCISGKKASYIAEWLYEDANVYLDRKYKIYEEYRNAQTFSAVGETQQGHNPKTSNP